MSNRYTYVTPYEYKEYPKFVSLPDGSQVVVNDEDEEQVVTAKEKRSPGRPKKNEEAKPNEQA